MSDTVGFISDLPTQLVAAFRATLEEVLSADLICHVRDISHPETDSQAEDVRRILADLGVDQEIKTIEVWNKLDRLSEADLETRQNMAARDDSIFVTSALTGAGLEGLLEAISRDVTEATTQERIELGFDEGRRRAWLFEQEVVDREEATEAGFTLSVTWSAKQKARFDKL
jgi:GTP-binding protein HflX